MENILNKLKKVGFNNLRNESKTVKDLQFIGIDDSDDVNQVKNKLKHIKVDKTKFSTLLYHKPSGHQDAANKGIDFKACRTYSRWTNYTFQSFSKASVQRSRRLI